MKVEAWIFAITTAFFVVVSPAYWLIAGDWTGTSALVMTTLLAAMVTLYLGFHAAKMDARPEDRKDAAIAAWWLVIIGFGLGALALSGWVFEYYRGEHAH